jgi:hypothetical protein
MPSSPSPSRLVIAAIPLAALLAGCGLKLGPSPAPTPDITITADTITTTPQVLGTIVVPGGGVRWVEVEYRSLQATPALMYFEVQGSGAEGSIQITLRRGGAALLASRSARRFGSDVSVADAARSPVASGVAPAGDGGEAVEPAVDVVWRCLGPCLARPYESGTYLVRVENVGGIDRRLSLLAYALEPTDRHEPNDSAAQATPVELAGPGDGASGAIEHVGDVDYFRLECAAGFGEGMELELVSAFEGAIELRAEGRRYGPGEPTDPLPCGSVVSVRTSDGTAGPSSHSRYTLLADPAPLFALDVTAQGLTADPQPLGALSLPPNRTRVVRLTFPPADAGLRFVEVSGASVDGNVRIELLEDGQRVGVSERRDRYAASTSVLTLAASAAAVEPSSVSVNWSCQGPCVGSAYRAGEVLLRVTNLTSTTRPMQVYGYGAPEADDNEPNESAQDATLVTLQRDGDGASGALERIGDVDYFRFECGAGFPFGDVRLTLTSAFGGDIVLQLADGTTYGPGATTRVLACDSVVSVRARDGSAGPSAASRYQVVAN